MKLTADYREYLDSKKPTCGFTDLKLGGYFDLEPFESISKLNSDIEINQYAPGFLAFASDGGGEVLAFDIHGRIYSIPLVGMSSEAAVMIADSWSEYESHIQHDA